MSILFDWYETPDPTGEREKTLLHPRPFRAGTVRSRDIERDIEQATTFTRADVAGALKALSAAVGSRLAMGQGVRLDGIGSFSVTLTVAGTEVEPDTKRKGALVRVSGIRFEPDAELLRHLGTVHCEQLQLTHSADITDAEVDRRVKAYLAEHHFFRRRDLETLCRLTKATALRHICRMTEAGLVKREGPMHQPIYVAP